MGEVAVKPPIYTRSQLEATFLPIDRMLQIDRVTDICGNEIVCGLDIHNHWYFRCIFLRIPFSREVC